MRTFLVKATIEVEAQEHAEAVKLVFDAIKDKTMSEQSNRTQRRLNVEEISAKEVK